MMKKYFRVVEEFVLVIHIVYKFFIAENIYEAAQVHKRSERKLCTSRKNKAT